LSLSPPPEGGAVGVSDALGVDTRRRYAAVDMSLRTALFGVGLEQSPADAVRCAVLATAPFASGVSKI
jgi:hypothetical protein